MSSSVAKAPNDSPAKEGEPPSVPTCDVLAGPAPGQELEGEGEEEEGFSAAASNSEEPNGESARRIRGRIDQLNSRSRRTLRKFPSRQGITRHQPTRRSQRAAPSENRERSGERGIFIGPREGSGSRSVNDPPGEQFYRPRRIGPGAGAGAEPSPGRIDSRPAGRRASSVACAWPFRKRSSRRKASPDDAETEYLRRGREFEVATPRSQIRTPLSQNSWSCDQSLKCRARTDHRTPDR